MFMKKKIISSIVLTSILLCGCASKEAKFTEKEEDEEVKTEETEASEETEETEVPEEPSDTTEGTQDTEPTEPEPDVSVGFWIDSNLNFGYDKDDVYCINMDQVSMKDYFAKLEEDEVFRSSASFSKIVSSPLSFFDDEVPASECDYITTTQIELESPGVEVGAVSTDNVRIDEENCMTYYTVDIPQIDLGTSDCEKANKEIVEFVEGYDWWYGMPTVRYRFFEHEDGSKTFVIFYGDGSDDSMFKSFTFDSNGKRMSTDDIIKSAGWEPSEFEDKALSLIKTDLAYANDFDVYVMYGIVNSTLIDSVKNDPDVFVNENGDLVVITKVDFFDINGFYMIPYALDTDIDTSDGDSIPVSDLLAEQGWRIEFYKGLISERLTDPVPEFEVVTLDDIDVSNVPDSLYGASETYGALYFSGGCGYTFGDDVAKTMPASIIAYLNERVYEDSEYKYEVYLEGELIKTDTIKAEATPFFRQISTEFELDRVTDKVYCIVLYDANGSENILGVIWHVEIDY